jgi:hypothetical protein
VKGEGHSEGDIVKLMDFLGEEVDGTLTTQKIRGETSFLQQLVMSIPSLGRQRKW